ncbi:MAG: 5,10-methylenetetrahydromethanopterin reductase [Promethearchaeota archaeon]
MCNYSDLEPLIVTSHDKGLKRGIAIYFGVNELNELEKYGVSLRTDRRFLCRITTDNKIVLIPFSQLDFLLDIEEKLDRIIALEKEEKEEFGEELLTIISENEVKINENERYSVLQITKGHYTRHNIRILIRISLSANRNTTETLIDNFLEKRRLNQMVDKKVIEDFFNLPKEDIEEFRDELIDIIINNDVSMTQEEKSAMFQFVKGQHGKSLLSSVLNLVNKTDPNAINQLSTKFLTGVIKPTKPELINKPTPIEINKPIKPEVKFSPSRRFEIIDAPRSLLQQVNSLDKAIQSDLIDDLLSILSEDELKEFNLTPREQMDVHQLIKGHYTPARLFNALQIALRVIEEKKWKPGSSVARKLDKKLRFGVELVPATGLDKLVKYGRKFEAGGIDQIWITDHYTNMDPYVTLTLMARATSAAQLGVGVTNPYLRHLASTASAIASLDRVSNNRMVLGLGAGDKSTLAALNIETQSALRTVFETVKAIRMLWNEDSVNFAGEIVNLKNARLNFKPDRKIPVYIGAQGPKMLKLAGEIGEGVLINGSNELDFEYARKNILEGVKKANKSINETDIVAYTCFSTSEDSNAAIKATIPVVTFIAAATPPKVLERHDLNLEKASRMKDFLSKGDMSKAFQLVDNNFIDAFSISGTPQQCINKIENLEKAGVTQFVFGSPLGPKKGKAINLITERILANYS